jgi:hypothetical protein
MSVECVYVLFGEIVTVVNVTALIGIIIGRCLDKRTSLGKVIRQVSTTNM